MLVAHVGRMQWGCTNDGAVSTRYDIEVLPLVPPMSNGNSHEAKVARFDRRQRSSRLDSVSPLSFGLRRAKTEAEAVQMVEADVEKWISER